MRHHKRLLPSAAACAVALAVLTVLTVPTSPAASAPPWQPGPAGYDVGTEHNVPITMDDGTVLKANVYSPIDRATGAPAPGPFPVVLTETPYGKDKGESDSALGDLGMGRDTYLIQRGYIHAVVDVRGTGASQGVWSFLQPRETADSVAVVDWAAALPHSTGAVGMIGQSYGGLDQLMAAGAVGPGSPLKAILPIVPGDDLYRDVFAAGGIPDPLLPLIYLAANVPLNEVNAVMSALGGTPTPEELADLLTVVTEHLGGLGAVPLLDLVVGGPNVFDGGYWAERRPDDVLGTIVANDIPTMVLGGWRDAFQRGEPLIYAGLQNAAAHRAVHAPMVPGQPISGKYQLVQGPWYHSTVGEVASNPLLPVNPLALRWFDQWLKGEDTGVAATSTPLHTFDVTANTWTAAATYPFASAEPTKLYFDAGRTGTVSSSNDGALSTTRPATAGTDQIVWSNVPLCTPSTSQFVLLGNDIQSADANGTPRPACSVDDRPVQAGAAAATYTTAPMTTPQVIAGPIAARLYAAANTVETEWVVRVDDVAPDGTSTPLTRGSLLGSMRTLDPDRTWTAPDGSPIRPYQPMTQASQQLLAPGSQQVYDVEVFPTHATIAAGHRIRVTVSSNDSPALVPAATQVLGLAGGVYQIQRGADRASYVQLPLAPAGGLGPTCTDPVVCPPAG